MKLFQPLTISLLTHLCLLLALLLLPPQSEDMSKLQEVEIVYQNEPLEKKLREVVISPEDKLKDAVRKLKDTADRLSLNTQRVQEESVAPPGQQTRNSQAKSLTQNNRREAVEKNFEKNFNDQPSINRVRNDLARDTRLADSSISQYIPEVRSGGFTALNTDQFIHYTFYARTHEQIRNRWITQIRSFIDSSMQTEINRLAQRTQVSQIEVILTPDGHFVRALIHQKADNSNLDEAAISAFRLAAPFNNPPSEMIEPDGYIHLHYAFHVFFAPRYIANGAK